MAKHAHPAHPKGAGKAMIGKIDLLVGKIVTDKQECFWATEEIANEGPEHKQILSALLITQVQELVHTIEKINGTAFKNQHGLAVIKEKDGQEKLLPVTLPLLHNKSKKENEDIAAAVSKAPAHEALAYLISLQAIEWCTQAMKGQAVEIE